jgi:protein tyrosine phosphatase (PTP) superfamily phosphohydrolase (DUF442 family)
MTAMSHHAVRLLACAAALGLAFAIGPATPPATGAALAAPNVVEVSPSLVTSGQPSARTLEGLARQGFEAVVYLAPPTVSDAVRDEPLIVARQGLVFVNIPIRFDQPTAGDYRSFAGVMAGLAGRKVLVHCQVNLRASTMVFLYRAIHLRDDPATAYEAVARVWSPSEPWKALVRELLGANRITFDPY